MYGVKVEYHTEDHHGEVRKRTETLVLALQPGEHVITKPKVVVIGEPVSVFTQPTVEVIPSITEPVVVG